MPYRPGGPICSSPDRKIGFLTPRNIHEEVRRTATMQVPVLRTLDLDFMTPFSPT
jgi:hypothetical protein